MLHKIKIYKNKTLYKRKDIYMKFMYKIEINIKKFILFKTDKCYKEFFFLFFINFNNIYSIKHNNKQLL